MFAFLLVSSLFGLNRIIIICTENGRERKGGKANKRVISRSRYFSRRLPLACLRNICIIKSKRSRRKCYYLRILELNWWEEKRKENKSEICFSLLKFILNHFLGAQIQTLHVVGVKMFSRSPVSVGCRCSCYRPASICSSTFSSSFSSNFSSTLAQQASFLGFPLPSSSTRGLLRPIASVPARVGARNTTTTTTTQHTRPLLPTWAERPEMRQRSAHLNQRRQQRTS